MQQHRRQSKSAFSNVSEVCIAQIKQRLSQYHSPEQIAGRLRREGAASISHEAIYQMIYADHAGLSPYQQYLRQGRGKRRRRGGSHSKRGQIPGRVGIECRPPIADAKTEMGHWESDTMIGGNHHGVIVTHVDKASKLLVAGLGKNKISAEINKVAINLFSKIPELQRRTMTSDNGKEFSGHLELSESLELSCYFAPTAELMTEFYRQFQQTDNKAQALRQAMLNTMAQHPNPRDWAAFTLIGEAR